MLNLVSVGVPTVYVATNFYHDIFIPILPAHSGIVD